MRFLGFLPEDAAAPDGAGEIRASFPWEPGAPAAAVERRLGRFPGKLEAEAARELLRWNLDRGADPSVAATWEEIQAGRGVVVLTGQQPALWGGPLYTLYKLLTAVALARELSGSLGVPALAVFWIVGDDSDFGEVSSAYFPSPDGRLLSVRDLDVPPGGTLIGTLASGRQRALLGPLRDSWGSRIPRARTLDLLEEITARDDDWSGTTAGILFALLPGLPFLALDGAHPALLRAQSGFLADVASRPLEAWLREGDAEARAAGVTPSLDPGLGARALFRIEGGRRDPLTGRPGGTERLGPNVVLRPLVQDLLLPNIATVCGPSELRYRAQLGPVYRGAEVPRPLLYPRWRNVLVPPLPDETTDPASGTESGPTSGTANAFERYRSAVEDPAALIQSLEDRAMPRALMEEIERVRLELRGGLEALRDPLKEIDSSLPQMLESIAGKADYQIGRIPEGIRSKIRHRLNRQVRPGRCASSSPTRPAGARTSSRARSARN